MTSWDISVTKWAACEGVESTNLGFIPALLRRRLSPLARCALYVANVCTQECSSAGFVFASRHGELHRTVELLGNLARDEDLSPTLFSLSVLNSAAGIFSIARNDHAPATAIAAGNESFGYGLLEAHLRARRDPNCPVVYVYADAPVPDPLGRQPGDPEAVFALGLLIESKGSTCLHTEIHSDASSQTSPTLQAHACLQALEAGVGAWTGERHHWRWSLQ